MNISIFQTKEKHNMHPKNTKVAYIKNSDVIKEIGIVRQDENRNLQKTGGPYHYISNFLNWSDGCLRILISMDKENKKYDDNDNTKAYVINTKLFKNVAYKIHLQTVAFFKILFLLIKFKPNFIICAIEGGAPLVSSYLAAIISGARFVHSRHMRVKLFNPPWYKRFKQFVDFLIIKKADWVLCNGPYLKDQLLDIGIDNKRILKFGSPYDSIIKETGHTNSKQKKNDAYCKKTVLYVGRIERKKGVLDLLHAFNKLFKKDNRLRLIYIGDGKDKEILKKCIEHMKLKERVFLLGQQPHEKVIKMMIESDILAVPTRRELGEGWCKTVIEGLILGSCIVAPDYGAFQYLIKNNISGMLYAPDNVEDLLKKLSHLIENPELINNYKKNSKRLSGNLINPELTFRQALERASVL